ncbi:hypothetical protein K8R03_02575 [Candidatus Kaiserbacteria bacterium]|nr:hypothetical protein [Candidatus Kaiserbacteria bacterium]
MKMAFTTAALALALCVMSSASNAQYYGHPPTSRPVSHRPPPRNVAPPRYTPPRYSAPRHHYRRPPVAAIAIPLAVLGVMEQQMHRQPRYHQNRNRQRVQSSQYGSQWGSGFERKRGSTTTVSVTHQRIRYSPTPSAGTAADVKRARAIYGDD